MSGYIKLISGSVMAGIFVMAILLFAVNFANDNDSDISLGEDARWGNLNSTMTEQFSNLSDDAETSQEMLFRTTLESGDEHSSTGAQFKIGPLTAMSMTISSFGTAFNSIFGPGFSFIAGAFVSLIMFIIGYYTIKAWLGRSPD